MKKLMMVLMAVLFMTSSLVMASPIEFPPHDTNSKVTPTYTAKAAYLHNTSTGDAYVAAGVCSQPVWDVKVAGTLIGSAGEVCGYAGGTVTPGTEASFAAVGTVGASIMGIAHADIGVDTLKGGAVVGLSLVIPMSLGQ